MTTYVAPTTDDLQAIAEQVWASYLDMSGCDPLVALPGEEFSVDVSASVSVTGAWQGHIVVSCSNTAAKYAAGELLGVEQDDVTDADVADALGELANIIGGNVKSLLPEPCGLSLPRVVVSSGNLYEQWPQTAVVCQLGGLWRGEPLTVVVLESLKKREA
jgi:chemotaxis protein CheX